MDEAVLRWIERRAERIAEEEARLSGAKSEVRNAHVLRAARDLEDLLAAQLARGSDRRQVLLRMGWLLIGLALTELFGLLVIAVTDPTKNVPPWLYLAFAVLVGAGGATLRAGLASR